MVIIPLTAAIAGSMAFGAQAKRTTCQIDFSGQLTDERAEIGAITEFLTHSILVQGEPEGNAQLAANDVSM